MSNCPFFKPVGLLAGILGLLQGIAWFLMSLLAILIYSRGMDVPTYYAPSFGKMINIAAAASFYETPDGNSVLKSLNGDDLLVWTILYLILSIIWICASIFLITVILNKMTRSYSASIVTWSSVAIIIWIVDLTLIIAFGTAMSNANEIFLESDIYTFIQWTTAGILMTVAARGYVLWIINFALAILLLKIRAKVKPMKSIPRNIQYSPDMGYPAQGFDSPWSHSQMELDRPTENQWRSPANQYQNPANQYASPVNQQQYNQSTPVVRNERVVERNYSAPEASQTHFPFDWEPKSSQNIARPKLSQQQEYKSPYAKSDNVRIPDPDYTMPSRHPFGNSPLRPGLKYPAPQRPNIR